MVMSGIAPWQPALHGNSNGVGMTSWAQSLAQLLALVAAGRSDAAAALITTLHDALRTRVPALPALATNEPYARAVIHADSHGEILLMHWRSAAVSAIHDHGDAAGMVVALEGEFVEQTVQLLPTGTKVSGKRTMLAGQSERIDVVQGDYHVMCAPRGGISLHIYTPTPRVMRVVDPEQRKIWIVGEGHGAWLPVEPALVKGQLPWPA
jgi:hypothetical protein